MGVRGQEFVDKHLNLREGGVVGRGDGGVEQRTSHAGLAVRNGSEAAAGREFTVVDVIQHRGHVGLTHQRHGTTGGRQTEVRVQFGHGGLRRLVVGPDDEVLAGREGGPGGEGPAIEIGVVVGEIESVETHGGGTRVVDLDIGIVFPCAIHRAANIVGQHLVDPKGWERLKRGTD